MDTAKVASIPIDRHLVKPNPSQFFKVQTYICPDGKLAPLLSMNRTNSLRKAASIASEL